MVVAVILGMSLLVVRGLGVRGAAPEQPAAPPANARATAKEIAKDQIALAKLALDGIAAQRRLGRGGSAHTGAEIHRWNKRLIKALRTVGDRPELVKALKGYVAVAKGEADLAEQRLKVGFGGIDGISVADVKYRYLEAQRWLAEEK